MLQDERQLGAFLGPQADRLGLRLAFDTHYDAQNWELSWWRGRTLHRLDFQPLGTGKCAVTHYRDQFRLLPRFLRWAHYAIPMFPYAARVSANSPTTILFPVEERDVSALILKGLAA